VFAKKVKLTEKYHAAMTNSATADSVAANPENVMHFKMIMFGLPIALFVIAIIVFAKKVKLTEKYHADIVDELTQKLENK
jgi:lactose/raffinose/galactose permease